MLKEETKQNHVTYSIKKRKGRKWGGKEKMQ